MSRWTVLAVLVAAIGALALRIPSPGLRPLHNDEAVNAFKLSELWQEGHYAYDPDEYHGPTLHYFSLPALWSSGAQDASGIQDGTLRLTPIAFGVGLVLLSLLFADGLGRTAVIWAAGLTAVSPAMVFYSRYFIHEMLLVFFVALTVGAAWRYFQTRSSLWAVTGGIGLGLTVATKETFVLTLAALFLAGAITAARWWPAGGLRPPEKSEWRHLALFLGTAVALWVVLFSSFFTNASGPLDSLRTYLPWLKRAGGESVHNHPWHFYLHRLAWFHPARSPVWSEGLVLLLAGIGGIASLIRRRSPLHHFLALYTLALTAIYSVISYKTPWCLLGFLHGMILLAGIGAATLVRACRQPVAKIGVSVLLAALTAQLGWQAWQGSHRFAADPRNPYVYAQTAPNLLELVQRVEGIAGVAPTGHETVIKVMAPDSDYWPIPWYLRRFSRVGYWPDLAEDPYAPVMLVSSQFNARLDERSEKRWIMAGIYALRPGRFFELYVELELWKRFVETLPPPED